MTQADFMKALQDRKEISITVKGRRSGREVTLPVWFAREGSSVWLLPLHGSRTQWYRNVLANLTITVRSGGRALSVSGRPRTDRTAVERLLDQFREKYGTGDVARYYDHSDAVVELPVGAGSDPGTRRPGG
jgi:deazaflavin-dependent oxidoreductase (nitroreductase family)